MDAIRVTGSDIMEKYGGQSVIVEPLTALQKAGMRILLGVGIVSVLAIAVLTVQWISQTPKFPTLPANPADAQEIANTTTLLEIYKTASQLALSGPKDLFDMIILKVLYPLFTLVLGYVFGTRTAVAGKT